MLRDDILKIVVTNDDGIYTPGIWTLAEALARVGEVIVVAPDREQSGVGFGMSFRRPVKATEASPRVEGVRAYSVEGTPADSVLIALAKLAGGPVDLVVSGINDGANVGYNVLLSGTVGGAFQSHFRGVPAMAVSVAVGPEPMFQPAARLAEIIASMFRDGTISGSALFNVNLPYAPLDQIQGVEVTRLAMGKSTDSVKRADEEKRDYYWLVNGKAEWQEEHGTDVWALKNKRASITPLHMDLTSDVIAPLVGKLSGTLFERLRAEE